MEARHPLRGNPVPALPILFLAVALSCSGPNGPQDSPVPREASFRGTIPAGDLPGDLSTRLVVRSRAGSTALAADGSFVVPADTTSAEQPLLAVTSDGTPVFLAFRRTGEGTVSLGCESTVASLLAIDPLLLGLPASTRDSLVNAAGERAVGAAALLRGRLAAGRTRSLVDREDLELQGILAGAIREAGAVVDVDCPMTGDPVHPAGAPRVESGPQGSHGPTSVNPIPTNLVLSIDDYFDGVPRTTVTIDAAPLAGLGGTGEPARRPIELVSGRYRTRFRAGVDGAAGSASSPAWPAFCADLALTADAVLDLLRLDSVAAWRRDPGVLEPERLDRIEAFRGAFSEADPHALVRATFDLLVRNPDLLLAGPDRDLAETLCDVGAAQAEAGWLAYPGPLLCALTHPSVSGEGYVRVRGTLVSPIDPPDQIRRPTGLDATYIRGRVALSWRDAANNEEQYVIERTSNGASEELARLGEDAHTYTDRTIQPATIYQYRVMAINRLARSEWSVPLPLETPAEIDTIIPAAVTDLRAEPAGSGSILLSWTAPGDDGGDGRAAGYELRCSMEPINAVSWYQATTLQGAPAPGPSGTTERFFADGLLPGVTYYFALMAFDNVYNRSRMSNVVSSVTYGGPSWSTEFAPDPDGQGLDGSIEALTEYDGDVVAGGSFIQGSGSRLNFVGRWTGSAWLPLGTGVDHWVFSLTTYNGDLIAGGTFNAAGEVAASHIARWDGTRWWPLGDGLDGIVHVLYVYRGELYAGGSFQHSGDRVVRGIARWDGREWQPLGSGVDNQVFGLVEYQGDLVVGGDFGNAGGAPDSREIARWDGSTWSGMGGGMDLDYVWAFAVDGTDLYAGGQFVNAGHARANSVARWDGTEWHALGQGMDRWVYGLIFKDGELIACGTFLNAGGVPAAHLARWNGERWAPFPGGFPNSEVHAILDVGPDLFLGGWFTRIGNLPSSFVARWGP